MCTWNHHLNFNSTHCAPAPTGLAQLSWAKTGIQTLSWDLALRRLQSVSSAHQVNTHTHNNLNSSAPLQPYHHTTINVWYTHIIKGKFSYILQIMDRKKKWQEGKHLVSHFHPPYLTNSRFFPSYTMVSKLFWNDIIVFLQCYNMFSRYRVVCKIVHKILFLVYK